jgi:two-component system sensor histidine kinase PilS (NtrC family)
VKHEFSKKEYSARIIRLIWGRAVLATFLVGTLLYFQQRYKIYSFNANVLYGVLFVIYILTATYYYLLGRLKDLLVLAYLQVSIDILLITFLVYLTGGIDSSFSILYHLSIISASIILYRRGGYLAASLSSILYGTMLDMQYYSVLDLVRSQNFTNGQVLYQVIISILSFYAVALLTSYLSERLRTARQELQEKSHDFEDLRVLQDHILRSVGSGILTVDLQGRITSWNPAAEQITGYSYEEIKKHWQKMFGNSIKELFGRADSLKERSYRFNTQILKKDGRISLLGMTASLLRDDANFERGIILTFQDITKLVEMEEQMRRQERLATVGSLAAGIAHEIRNPLASVSGSIQLLQGELNLGGDEKRLMDIVVRETDRLNTIITDFLEYARPKNGNEDNITLGPLVNETIMLLKNSRNFNKDVRIECDIDNYIKIKGDAQRLTQVFWNLLINACQAMPDGGVIAIASSPVIVEGDLKMCEIILADTGQGIARDFIEKIFDPFFTTKTEGTGLGLAIAYRIIDDHNGTISAESEVGKGTRFIIRLPLGKESDNARQPKVSLAFENGKGKQT